MTDVARRVQGSLLALGELSTMVSAAFARLPHLRFRVRGLDYQLVQVGVRSLPLTLAMAAVSGMVLAFQFGHGLERFGARLFIGQTTVTALFRELGPILTALIVGGRVGSGIAAELGGMAVTEQVDALRALGADPIERLVLPRLLATAIGLPLLAVLADVVAVIGAILVAKYQYDVSATLFLNGVYDFVTLNDFTSGIIKSVAFGLIIGAVACHAGLSATGGTEGVGRATTRAVVAGALSVLAADLVLTKLLLPR